MRLKVGFSPESQPREVSTLLKVTLQAEMWLFSFLLPHLSCFLTLISAQQSQEGGWEQAGEENSEVLVVLGAQEAEDLREYFNSALNQPAVSPVLFHSSQQSLFGVVPNKSTTK